MRTTVRLLACGLALTLLAGATSARRWGWHGHEMAGRAAATRLPAELPAFFREARDELAYLNPEPDRWRSERGRELGEATRYDHYVDREVLPDSALHAADRWAYYEVFRAAGVAHPRDAGFLPFRILELQQRLEVQFRLWRNARTAAEKVFIEGRIVQDAGILGHYVLDGSNPHHTTVHHDRWAEGYPNPHGFTTERGFHGRFESQFVRAKVGVSDLLPRVAPQPRHLPDVRTAVLAYLDETHGQLERLYRLDRQERFGAETRSTAHKEFAVQRLVAGVDMLRDLWWTAWLDSAEPATRGTPVPEETLP